MTVFSRSVPVRSAWSLWAGKASRCKGRASSQHAGADGDHVALGLLQDIVGFDAALQRVAELARVEIAAEAPVVVVAAAEAVLEVLVEFGHGVQGRTGGAGVSVGLVGGDAGADLLVDQGDVALVLVDGHLGPDVGGGHEVGGGLIEIEVDLLQAGDDLADALRFGGVFEHVGGEEGVAQGLDVHLRAVEVAVDLGEVEQVEGDLVLEDGEIGAVFRGQAGGLEFGQAVVELLVERALAWRGFSALKSSSISSRFCFWYWCSPAAVAEEGEKAREP